MVNFARDFDPDRSVYTLPPHGTSGVPKLGTIEEMAQDYLQKIRKQFPNGPYLLGGYCNGGIVAYEIARRLHAEREDVGPVLLVAASPVNGYFHWLKSITDPIATMLRLKKEHRLRLYFAVRTMLLSPRAFFMRSLEVFRSKNEPDRTESSKDTDKLASEAWLARYNATGASMNRYFPKPFPGKLHLIWATEDETRINFPQNKDYGWGALVKQLSIETVPGNHLSIVWRDYAKIAAAAKRLYQSYR